MLTFSAIAEAEQAGQPAVLCTVVQTTGSTPQKVGAKMLVFADGSEFGRIQGTVGGGTIEHSVRKKALSLLGQISPTLFEVALTQELGMCCGGSMSILCEPLMKKSTLICFGAGHIVQALCPLAVQADFFVTVADPRLELLNLAAFENADKLSYYSPHDIAQMPFDSNTFVIIATHDHAQDQALAEAVLLQPFRYAALVGSRRKAHMTKLRLQNKGFLSSQIERLYCPAGLKLGGTSPFEIAISILAQMLEVKYGKPPHDGSHHCRSWSKPAHGKEAQQSTDAL